MTEPELTATLEPEFRKVLGEYLRVLADALGLRDWTIHVMHEAPTNDRHQAAVECLYGRKHANIYFRRDFAVLEADEQKITCLHELLHAHLDGMTAYAGQILPDLLGKPAYKAFFEAWHLAYEHAVDAIAESIAPRFPSPPWAEG